MTFWAHSDRSGLPSTDPNAKWQPLSEHLNQVADKAETFARKFGAEEEGRIAGWLHDLGKFREEFQAYLKNERQGGVETHHAVYGAALAFQRELPCAFAIAGHHAGLHDRHRLQSLIDDPKYDTTCRLPLLEQRFRECVGKIPATISLPQFVQSGTPWNLELYIRMIFSCLVDADYLDTEKHSTGISRTATRLEQINDQIMKRLNAERKSKPLGGTVNHIRSEIFNQCLEKASQKQGFFSLTVPTGGGKTLSGMAFALAHAQKWNLDRIIVVIPYLSIIEQNAAEYRRILDPDNLGIVIEHHSAVPVLDDNEARERSPLELAVENWDAPIVVTTSVQFIESLFAASPSKCRKLHNITRSVVLLDEVQTLPTHLLNPLLNVFRELRENYSMSFLFMTATQPAFRHNSACLSEGFKPDEVTEITKETDNIFTSLRRVDYQRAGALEWHALSERIAALQQALCVVNVRKHAFELWETLRSSLPDQERDSLFHLSSAMCPEHRLWALGEVRNPRAGSIRDRLQRGLPCRVASTQLVEAGVDVDFPVVFRALGPLDSIVQAAGRCNREMKLTDEQGQPSYGKVVIFEPADHSLPRGIYKTATDHTAVRLADLPISSLGCNPDIFGDYFSQLFQLTSTDHARLRESTIQDDRKMLLFREVSRKARVIEDDGVPVIVPYGEGKKLIDDIRARKTSPGRPRFDRHDLRSLQRSMVNVRTHDFQRLVNLNMAVPLLPNLELYCLEEGCYHPDLGLLIDKRPTEDFCGV
ncbi:MAG: CRISPR-associated endonuclease Cas3'' [Acidobacteria bacterium RIFCSPLOWO2_12_FULL_60_22]|nr:MAG: CRISPR-associated endonuclease Cas3'' [Acidobacteria bacterium RIFCSPLOWO2_12_FULL_60_22]